MSDRIVYLKPPQRAPAAVTAGPAVVVGQRYQLGNDVPAADEHGICGGLDYARHHGRVLPVAPTHAYLWDVDDELTSEDFELVPAEGDAITLTPATEVITSRFVLSHAALSEPQIINAESTAQLITTASFAFVFSTSIPSVQLGLLSLVETQRFAVLKNSERFTLLDSGEGQPVLYLADTGDDGEVVSPVLEGGAARDTVQHEHQITLTQSIPEQLNGVEVETLTVLEQYTSYFMQRALPFAAENIWTPVCAPISWGWSMRVAKRQDGDWCIVRQKLLMPTVGHNGLELPVWETNQLDG